MKTQDLGENSPLLPDFICQIAHGAATDEISNFPGAVRRYIYNSGQVRGTGRTQRALLFSIYQTERHGPQNGFRLCLVHQGFELATEVKAEGTPDDEVDLVEKAIPQGLMEMAILGEEPEPIPESC